MDGVVVLLSVVEESSYRRRGGAASRARAAAGGGRWGWRRAGTGSGPGAVRQPGDLRPGGGPPNLEDTQGIHHHLLGVRVVRSGHRGSKKSSSQCMQHQVTMTLHQVTLALLATKTRGGKAKLAEARGEPQGPSLGPIMLHI